MCSDVRPTACNFLIGVFGFRYTGTKFSVSFVLLFCLRRRDYLVGGEPQGGRALLEMSKIFHKFCPNFLNIPVTPHCSFEQGPRGVKKKPNSKKRNSTSVTGNVEVVGNFLCHLNFCQQT